MTDETNGISDSPLSSGSTQPKTLIRLQQRFVNFEKAFFLLKEGVDRFEAGELDNLAKEGVLQRFEFTFDLAWKTLKDFLDYTGRSYDLPSPRPIIKEAFAMEILSNGYVWLSMLETRNLLSHTYDESHLNKTMNEVAGDYFPAVEELYLFLKNRNDLKKQ